MTRSTKKAASTTKKAASTKKAATTTKKKTVAGPGWGVVERQAYSIEEWAAMFGVTRDTIHRRIAAGDLGTVRFGSRRMIPASELDRLMRVEFERSDGRGKRAAS